MVSKRQTIVPSHDGRMYFNNNKRELVILSLQEEDEGELKVVAENQFGRDESSCSLTIFSYQQFDATRYNTRQESKHRNKENNKKDIIDNNNNNNNIQNTSSQIDEKTLTKIKSHRPSNKICWRQDLLNDSLHYL